jgi:hypothetical protein
MLCALLAACVVATPGCSGDAGVILPVATAEVPPPTPPQPPAPPATDTAATPTLPPPVTTHTDTLVVPVDSTLITPPKPKDPPTTTPVDTATPAKPETPPPPPPPPPPPVSQPTHLVSLRLTVTSANVTSGSTLLVGVTGTLSDGNPTVDPPVQWSAVGGAVSQSGIFTAGNIEGPASVTVISGAVSATLPLVVMEALPPVITLPARSTDEFVNSIGVNIHLGYWDTPYGSLYESAIKPRLLQLGVRHVRDAATVVSDDSWMSSVYGRMQELAGSGIRFDLVMAPAQGVADFASITHWNRLMTFAAQVVESFEGLNEHDLSGRAGWVAETRSFQSALYAAVHGDSRTANLPVLGPSVGHPVNASALGSLEAFMDRGNLHPYPGGSVPLANVEAHERSLASLIGVHPSIITETGYHTAVGSSSDHPAVSEEAMARYVPRLVLDNFAAGFGRSYLYELIDEGTNRSEQEQNFGLLRHDGSAKPAFTALANLISILADGPGNSRTNVAVRLSGDLSGVSAIALTKRDGREYVVLWQDVSSYNLSTRSTVNVVPKNVTFRFTESTQVRLFDPVRSASPINGQSLTTLTVPVADSPIVVEITH